jgi:hypothetical protein
VRNKLQEALQTLNEFVPRAEEDPLLSTSEEFAVSKSLIGEVTEYVHSAI